MLWKLWKNKILHIAIIAVIVALLFSLPINLIVNRDIRDIKHETSHFAIIEDYKGNRMAIEPVDYEYWENKVTEYLDSNDSMHVDGVVVSYDNSWFFRINPISISIIAGNCRSFISIREISLNPARYLNQYTPINIVSIEFHEGDYIEAPGVVFCSILSSTSIVILALYLALIFIERTQIKLVKHALQNYYDDFSSLTISTLSEKTNMNQKRLNLILQNKQFQKELDILINNEVIHFQDKYYKEQILYIEKLLNNLSLHSKKKITLDKHSELVQFSFEIKEAQLYFNKKPIVLEIQNLIIDLKERIDVLIDSISLDDVKL